MIDTSALREKVLDLAIRGKLVPQDPNDEPASVLLERIRAEKEQMVKDGKLKAKDIKNDTIIFKGEDNLHYEKFTDGTIKCIEDEIPFDVPDGWAWCRLNSAVDVRDGTHDTPKYVSSGVPLITSKNLNEGGIDYSNVKFISELDAKIINMRSGVDVGDILYAMIGTIGNPAVIKENILISIKNVALFKFDYSLDLYNEYILLFLQYAQKDMKYNASGGLQPFVSLSYLRNYLVPIPPINEQRKISDVYKNIERNIDTIENNKSATIDLISSVKSKILDLAIQGKLVPQNQDDEPASILLERIKAQKEELIKQGKIKRDKKESIIFKGDDNSYYRTYDKFTECIEEKLLFDLPSNWAWVTLPNIAQIELGKTLDKAKNKGDYRPYIRSVNVQWGRIDLTDVKEMRFEENELERYAIKKGDMLICEGGDVGRCCIWEFEESILYQNAIHRVRFYDKINCKFYMYLMMFFESNGILKKISNGVTIKHLTGTALSGLVCPLPPLEEQKRIVDAIETAFEQLDNILNSI